MFVTVSKWTWLYRNATFSFVQDLRLALLFQPKREMERYRYPQKTCLTCTRIMEIGKASKSRWPRDVAAFKSLKTYIIIYYSIIYINVNVYHNISSHTNDLKGSRHDLKVSNITEHAWKLSSFGTVQALWSRRLRGLHNLTLLWVHLHRTCS